VSQEGLSLLIAAGVLAFVYLSMRPLITWLRQRAVFDIPNARSSHTEITPRGGGIAVAAGILLGLAVWMALSPEQASPLVLLGIAVLAVVSWLDDRLKGLPVGLRLGAQMLCVGVVLALLPAEATVTQGLLPAWLERVVRFFAWIGFTNLFNFMDGINGITAVETITIGGGFALVYAVLGEAYAMAPGAIVAAAALGFLPWNWGKAKVFLGDVGSVPVGYLLGALLLALTLREGWAAALILPMYYWMDATVTLLRRLRRGEKIWQPHRSHFYQQGSRKLGSHAAVALRIAALNLLLIVLAAISLQGGWVACAAILAAAILTAALCRHFAEPA